MEWWAAGLIEIFGYVRMYLCMCTGPCLMLESRAPLANASLLLHSLTFSYFIMLTQHGRRASALSDVETERLTRASITI